MAILLERHDRAHNVQRYYVLAIEPTLFGDVALKREWGRIGRGGGWRLDLHGSDADAAEALDDWLERKVRRGYRPTYQGKSSHQALFLKE